MDFCKKCGGSGEVLVQPENEIFVEICPQCLGKAFELCRLDVQNDIRMAQEALRKAEQALLNWMNK